MTVDATARWWEDRERDLEAGLAEARYDEQGDQRERRLDLEERRSCPIRPRPPIPDQWGGWPTIEDVHAQRHKGGPTP